jgi:uncharacterized membrane protein
MRGPPFDFARLTNLADGIFAVAMTFLAFTIQLPAATSSEGRDGGLALKLVALLPQLVILAFSYALAARYWVLHYKMHAIVVRGDSWLLFLNLCFLFAIVLVPFSADILGNFPLSPLSVTVYAANVAFAGTMLAVMWGYALLCPHISMNDEGRRLGRYYLTFSATQAVGFLASIAVAQVRPVLAIACWPVLLLFGHVVGRQLSLRREP